MKCRLHETAPDDRLDNVVEHCWGAGGSGTRLLAAATDEVAIAARWEVTRRGAGDAAAGGAASLSGAENRRKSRNLLMTGVDRLER